MVARDKREERESRDGRRFEVRSLKFSELRTLNFELRVAPVALFPLVSPVSLELWASCQGFRRCDSRTWCSPRRVADWSTFLQAIRWANRP